MSKLFMYGSEFQDVEQLMMLAPNFLPRKSGVIVVQRIRKEPRLLQKEKSSKRITDYCGSNLSGSLLNEFDFEHVDYEEILSRCFEKSYSYPLNRRISNLIRSYTGEFFVNSNHKSRFNTVCRIQNEPIESRTPLYLATLFLLTADEKLWCVTKDHIYLDHFDFKKMHLNGINTDGYALYQMVKTLQQGHEYIQLSEISDEYLIGEHAFKAIIHSVLIIKHGASVLHIKS